MRIALFQPDIPQNAGTILRLAACLSLPVDVIGPAGFLWDDRKLKRAGMDYSDLAEVTKYTSWRDFLDHRPGGRLILLTTKASVRHVDFAFRPDDTLLLGRESAGVPEEVHGTVDASVAIPLAAGARSLNVAVAAAMVAGEGLRQLDGWPKQPPIE